MIQNWAGIRSVLSAACALIFLSASVPWASARQNPTTDTTAQKQATRKSTAPKHHKKASSASAAKSPTATHTASTEKHTSRKKRSVRARGQQKIDSERAQAIQEALIREHYLTGEATGTWSQASEEAMRRYQADHGWQSKTVPDSRALISLGLGPNRDHLLNPESAMTSGPADPRSSPAAPASHGADPTGPPNPTPQPPHTEPAPPTTPDDAPHPQ